MIHLPDEIKDKIILLKIILLKHNNGWNYIHYHIKNLYLVLRLTSNIYSYEFCFEHIMRSTIETKPNHILQKSEIIRSLNIVCLRK